MNELMRMLAGKNPLEEEKIMSEEVMSQEIPAAVTGAENAQINEQATSPNMKTQEQLVADDIAKQQEQTVAGQLDQSRDIASTPNPEAPLVTQVSPEMQKYKDLITKYEAINNAPAKERSWQDSLPDALAGLHNIANYNAGNPRANMKMDHLSKQKAGEAAGRKEKMSGLNNLRDTYQKYMELQAKQKTPAEKDMTEYQRKSLKLQRDRLGLMGTKEGRLTKKDVFREEVGNRLSDAEVKNIVDLDDGTRILDEINELVETTDVESDLGPFDSRIASAKKYTSEQDPNFVKMKQLTGIQLAEYIKNISGAAVSEQEAQRLKENIPTVTDNVGEFKTKLAFFRKELADAKANFIGKVGTQKTGAKKFSKEKDKKEEKKGRSTEEVDMRIQRVVDANPGSTYEQVKKALKAKGKI